MNLLRLLYENEQFRKSTYVDSVCRGLDCLCLHLLPPQTSWSCKQTIEPTLFYTFKCISYFLLHYAFKRSSLIWKPNQDSPSHNWACQIRPCFCHMPLFRFSLAPKVTRLEPGKPLAGRLYWPVFPCRRLVIGVRSTFQQSFCL